MKYCKGCGKLISEINNQKIYCKNCFQLKNYGLINSDENNNYSDIEETLKKIKKIGGEVFLVIDTLNIINTIIKKINFYIKKNKLTIILNKIDTFPSSINIDKIINWSKKILDKNNIKYKNIIPISSFKKKNIDLLYFYIKKLNQNIHFIGYSNVGKSSVINAIFKSQKKANYNLVSENLNSTKEIIKSELKNINFFDYPGFYHFGNIFNYLTFQEMKKYTIKKEIKPKNFVIKNEKKLVIGQKIIVEIKSKNENELTNIQFFISNNVNILNKNKINYSLLNKKYNKLTIEKIENIDRQNVSVFGLGIIIFNPNKNDLVLYIPNKMKLEINSEESFLN